MTTYDLTKATRIIRSLHIVNAVTIQAAAKNAALPLPAACAMMQKESSGRNVYGNDAGGALAGYPGDVDESNFDVFLWMLSKGSKSNGVGPAQITFPGFFDQMQHEGLKPWLPVDNMTFAFRVLEGYKESKGTWKAAGTAYNGATAYGVDLATKVKQWRLALAPAKVTS